MPDEATNRELARRIDANDAEWFRERYEAGDLLFVRSRMGDDIYAEVGRRIDDGDLGWVGTIFSSMGLTGFDAAGPLLERERTTGVVRSVNRVDPPPKPIFAEPVPEPVAPEPEKKRGKAWLLIPVLIVVAILAFLLTQCGGDDKSSSPTTAPSTTLGPADVTASADESGRVSVSGTVGSDAAVASVMDPLRAALPNRVVGGLAVDPKAKVSDLILDLIGRAREPEATQIRSAVNGLAGVTVRDQLQVVEAPKLETDVNALLKAEPIQFDSGSAGIRPVSNATLDKLAGLLKATPTGKVTFEGHTDNVGDPAANLRLSQARADAVMKAMVARGVDAARLAAKGYGIQRPIADNATPEGRQLNRRVEALVTPD